MVCQKLLMQAGQESSLDLWSWRLLGQPAGFVLLLSLLPLHTTALVYAGTRACRAGSGSFLSVVPLSELEK